MTGNTVLKLPIGTSEPSVAVHLGLTLSFRELVQYLMDAAGVLVGHIQAYNPDQEGVLWLFPTYPEYHRVLADARAIGATAE